MKRQKGSGQQAKLSVGTVLEEDHMSLQQIVQLLEQCYEETIGSLDSNDEMVCRIIASENGSVIGHGEAYHTPVKCGSVNIDLPLELSVGLPLIQRIGIGELHDQLSRRFTVSLNNSVLLIAFSLLQRRKFTFQADIDFWKTKCMPLIRHRIAGFGLSGITAWWQI